MLVGRSTEKAVIDDLLASARHGTSGTLVLGGEAGIGKSALLRYAIEAADDMEVAVTSGTQSEVSLDFAGLHRLLLPSFGLRADLPEPQQRALAAAFGEVVGPPPDRFLVGLAALTLLTDAAARRPLLCVVDDAQWIDQESIGVLAFVARRLHADGIAVLCAIRSSPPGPDPLDGFDRLVLEGLAPDDAAALLERSAPVPPIPSVVRTITAETSGNPLALEELGRGLSEEQALGASALPAGLPVGPRLETSFLQQVRSLPAAAQTMLLVAAAEGSGDADLVRRAAAALDVAPDAADPAVAAGLVSLGPTIVFRHPLVRSAIYTGAAPAERRRAHAALGEASDGGHRPEQRALHRAAACLAPDGRVAAELEASARRARDRGGYAAEASLLIRAAELSPDPESRARLLLEAGHAALLQGSPLRVQALLDRAAPDLSTPVLRATAKRLRGLIQEPLGRAHRAAAVLLGAARDLVPLDPETARDVLLEAINVLMTSLGASEGTTMQEVARTALGFLEEEGSSDSTEDIMLGAMAGLFGPGHEASVPALRRAADALHVAITAGDDLIRWRTVAAALSSELFDDEAYRLAATRLEDMARERGSLLVLQYALIMAASFDTRTGQLGRARERYAEMLDVTEAIGSHVELYGLLDVELLAWGGEEQALRTKARALERAVRSRAVVYQAWHALIVLDLGLGRHADALATARLIVDDDEVPGWTTRTLPYVVEAAVRCGERDAASEALDRLAARVGTRATPLGRGLLARSRALVADGDDAEAHFREAIDRLGSSHFVTELAWAHLVHGEWLRRANRRSDARDALRTAHDLFSTMGAAAFAERTRLELEATGERARRRSVETAQELTPQEARVARLAAERFTSREIAAQMFISAKTVEYHLGKVFRKLGVSSRRDLAAALES